jgi:hypothetical protein
MKGEQATRAAGDRIGTLLLTEEKAGSFRLIKFKAPSRCEVFDFL